MRKAKLKTSQGIDIDRTKESERETRLSSSKKECFFSKKEKESSSPTPTSRKRRYGAEDHDEDYSPTSEKVAKKAKNGPKDISSLKDASFGPVKFIHKNKSIILFSFYIANNSGLQSQLHAQIKKCLKIEVTVTFCEGYLTFLSRNLTASKQEHQKINAQCFNALNLGKHFTEIALTTGDLSNVTVQRKINGRSALGLVLNQLKPDNSSPMIIKSSIPEETATIDVGYEESEFKSDVFSQFRRASTAKTQLSSDDQDTFLSALCPFSLKAFEDTYVATHDLSVEDDKDELSSLSSNSEDENTETTVFIESLFSDKETDMELSEIEIEDQLAIFGNTEIVASLNSPKAGIPAQYKIPASIEYEFEPPNPKDLFKEVADRMPLSKEIEQDIRLGAKALRQSWHKGMLGIAAGQSDFVASEKGTLALEQNDLDLLLDFTTFS